jgi:hypothetical protein
VIDGVCRLIANHHDLAIFESAPEVRALSSDQHYPASTVLRPRPTPAMAAAFRDVEAANLALDGSPPCIYEPPYRRAVPTTPTDRVGARVDCFPTRAAFPK